MTPQTKTAMKTETKLTILFSFALLMTLALCCHFTERTPDTDYWIENHSEIDYQDIAEAQMHERVFEPKYLNND